MEPSNGAFADPTRVHGSNNTVQETAKLSPSPEGEAGVEGTISEDTRDLIVTSSPIMDHGASVDAQTEASGSDHFSNPSATPFSTGTTQKANSLELVVHGDRSSSDTPTPSDSKRTYSFVFTSSRQQRTASGDRVIGIVNPSMARTLSHEHQPAPTLISDNKPILKPEQIRVHAFGAVHAISEHSPFQQQSRTRSRSAVAQFDLPIQTPLITDGVNPMERSLQTHGIDFYVSAVRAGRVSSSESSDSDSRPSNRRAISFTSTLSALGENQEHDPEPGSPTSRSEIVSFPTRRKRRMKNYTRYIEEDSENRFTTSDIDYDRKRDRSMGSSNSSTNSKYSIDESLSGLSAFGTIGSGSAHDIFGPTNPSTRSDQLSSSSSPRPRFSPASSGSTTKAVSAIPDPASSSTLHAPTPD
ncbi:hypothetical protein FRC17_000427 [Serendipita sp. 399]|nr:hypothetical protein FRC17_000427 [Serendipita sp. 399]